MKPTTIDGRPVLWHSVVSDKTPDIDPDEVAITEWHAKTSGVMIWGCYRGEWHPNAGSRAAASLLLAEVERLKALEATLPKTADGVTIHHGMRAWVVFNDYAGWYTISGMESPPSSGESWRLFCGAICLSDRDCYSSPEAAKESP